MSKDQKKNEEIERMRKKEEQTMEYKKLHLAEMESELKEKAKERIKKTLSEIRHSQSLEQSHQEMVLLAKIYG